MTPWPETEPGPWDFYHLDVKKHGGLHHLVKDENHVGDEDRVKPRMTTEVLSSPEYVSEPSNEAQGEGLIDSPARQYDQYPGTKTCIHSPFYNCISICCRKVGTNLLITLLNCIRF